MDLIVRYNSESVIVVFVSGKPGTLRPGQQRGDMKWAIVSTMRDGEMETWSGEWSVIKLIIPPVHDTTESLDPGPNPGL